MGCKFFGTKIAVNEDFIHVSLKSVPAGSIDYRPTETIVQTPPKTYETDGTAPPDSG